MDMIITIYLLLILFYLILSDTILIMKTQEKEMELVM